MIAMPPPRGSLADRIDMVRRLDVDAALAASGYIPPGGPKDNGQHADTRETMLAGMHKARLMYPGVFTATEMKLSRRWLLANGWKVPSHSGPADKA